LKFFSQSKHRARLVFAFVADKHQLPLFRILTDRGTEYCGKAETHDYQLYLAINDIEYTMARMP
jgi:hypothetical protein